MNIHRFRLYRSLAALAASVVVAPALWAASQDADGRFERTLKVTGAVQLTVATGSGRILVRSGDAAAVSVVGVIKVRSGWFGGTRNAQDIVSRIEKNPPIEQTGNVIHIGRTADRELYENVSISYEIVAPAETSLEAHSGSGSQEVTGLKGPVDVQTGSGSITLASVAGGARAGTGSGSIRGTGIGGGIRASTGSGSIELELAGAGDVEVQTGSGSIEVRGVRGALRANTGSGVIEAEGRPTGDWRAKSASGGIRLRLPSELAFDVDASTSSGRVSIDHPVLMQGSMDPKHVRGKVRGGGLLILVSTSSGSVHIN